MGNLERISVLLGLIDKMTEQGSWCGETHIQKTAYFLQELAEVPTEYEYVLYKHGPYSFELHDELSSIHADGLVELVTHPAPYGPSWQLTEAGGAFRSRKAERVGIHNSSISYVSERLARMAVAELERWGTALYVEKNYGHQASQERAATITKLKPHITPEAALSAVNAVGEMRGKLPASS